MIIPSSTSITTLFLISLLSPFYEGPYTILKLLPPSSLSSTLICTFRFYIVSLSLKSESSKHVFVIPAYSSQQYTFEYFAPVSRYIWVVIMFYRVFIFHRSLVIQPAPGKNLAIFSSFVFHVFRLLLKLTISLKVQSFSTFAPHCLNILCYSCLLLWETMPGKRYFTTSVALLNNTMQKKYNLKFWLFRRRRNTIKGFKL